MGINLPMVIGLIKKHLNSTGNVTEQQINNINKVPYLESQLAEIEINPISSNRYNTLLMDTFNRQNSTNIGTTESPTQIQWEVSTMLESDVGFSIVDNKLQGVPGVDQRAICTVESNICDDIRIDCELIGNMSMCLRATDKNNFIYIWYDTDKVTASKYANGVASLIKIKYLQNFNPEISTPILISAILNKDTISIYLDNLFIMEFVDSFNNTATKHGFMCRTSTLASNNKTSYFSIKKRINDMPIYQNTLNTTLPFFVNKENAGKPHSIVFMEDGVQFTLKKEDGHRRSEVALPWGNTSRYCEYSIDIRLDDDYIIDKGSLEIITQFHNTPNDWNVGLNPIIGLCTNTEGTYSVILVSSAVRNPTKQDCQIRNIKLSSFIEDVGKWVKWTFRINFSYNIHDNPFIEIYKNNKLIFKEYNTINCVNELKGAYFKFGIYKWDYVEYPSAPTVNIRKIKYRNLRVNDTLYV